MKKLLIISTMCTFAFSSVSIYVCGHTDDGAGNATFDVCMTSDEIVQGIQFSWDPGSSGFAISGGSGGAATDSGFMISANSSLILAFSMTGGGIDPMDGVLLTVAGTYDTNGETVVGPYLSAADAFSDPTAGVINVTTPATDPILATTWDAGNSSATLDGDLPATYSLGNNFPNPFNPTTTINYNVEEYGNVSIVIYDMTGRQVKELINENVTPQINSDYSVVWDGTNDAGSLVSAGTYICRMVSNDFVSTNKMTLMK